MITRPQASFVAHLIAIAIDTPQNRILRRASATDAIGDYRFNMARDVSLLAANGARLSRVA